jgi:hypothetical protein
VITAEPSSTTAPPLLRPGEAALAGEPSRAAWWAALTAMVVALTLPLLLVQVPPLTDYLNHLARMYVLAHPADPVLSRMLAPHWALLPNIAVDLVVPALMQVLPVYAAGKAMVLACVLVPVTGAVAYSRALFGRRSYWPVLAGLVGYNGLLLMGFLNFEFAIGAALWVAALWIRWRRERPAVAVVGAALGATVVFFFHIMGVAFLGLLMASHEAAGAWADRRGRGVRGLVASGWRRVGLLVLVFAIPAALYLASPFGGASGPVSWLSLREKVDVAFVAFLNYVPKLDLATGAAVAGVAVFALSRRGRAPLETLLCLAVLAVLFAVCPFEAKQSFFMDARFPVMAAFVLFAGLLPAPGSRWGERAAFAGLAALFALRMAVIGSAWLASAQGVAEVRAVLAPVQPGERVLAVDVTYDDNPRFAERTPRWEHVSKLTASYRLLGALALLEHKAFFDAEFAIPSQQPIQVQPTYRDASCPSGNVPSYTVLTGPSPPAAALALAPCLAHWRRDFDYVLVENAGGLADPATLLPADLELVQANPMAALYRVRRAAPPGDG